jgi:hypothetical protein
MKRVIVAEKVMNIWLRLEQLQASRLNANQF